MSDWICCEHPERPADKDMWLHVGCPACELKKQVEGDSMPFKGWSLNSPGVYSVETTIQ